MAERRDPDRLKEIIAEVVSATVQEAVPETVRHTFANLGLDVSTADAKIEAQKDFAFVRTGRKRRERFWEGAGAQFTKMTMMALGALGVLGAIAWIKGHL